MNTKDNTINLGIFIPVWNRGRLFKLSFESLLKHLDGIEATIWIYDNGSEEDTKKIIQEIHSDKHVINKVFLDRNMGIPYALNLFCKAMENDCDFVNYKSPGYVMLMDADAYFKGNIKDLLSLLRNFYQIGLLSGHDSIEHKALKEKTIEFEGKTLLLKEKENERMLTMLMRAEELLYCYPFPHQRNRDVDWELTKWNPNSMSKRGRRIVAVDNYVLHLGLNSSTWDNNKDKILFSEEEKKEVITLLKEQGLEEFI